MSNSHKYVWTVPEDLGCAYDDKNRYNSKRHYYGNRSIPTKAYRCIDNIKDVTSLTKPWFLQYIDGWDRISIINNGPGRIRFYYDKDKMNPAYTPIKSGEAFSNAVIYEEGCEHTEDFAFEHKVYNTCDLVMVCGEAIPCDGVMWCDLSYYELSCASILDCSGQVQCPFT